MTFETHNLDIKLHFKILVGVNKYLWYLSISIFVIQYINTAILY